MREFSVVLRTWSNEHPPKVAYEPVCRLEAGYFEEYPDGVDLYEVSVVELTRKECGSANVIWSPYDSSERMFAVPDSLVCYEDERVIAYRDKCGHVELIVPGLMRGDNLIVIDRGVVNQLVAMLVFLGRMALDDSTSKAMTRSAHG